MAASVCWKTSSFDNGEEPPRDAISGDYISLTHMPASLLLRAPDAAWVLPSGALPALPHGMSRRGLFQLRPAVAYLRLCVGKDKYISIRRTQFPVQPADARVVYGAQGETMKAVQVDMKRPPRMDQLTHWLACYVMLSRATSIDGLLVLRPALREELSSPPPEYLIQEIERLQQVEATSTDTLWDHLRVTWQSAGRDVPAVVSQLFSSGIVEQETTRVQAARSRQRSQVEVGTTKQAAAPPVGVKRRMVEQMEIFLKTSGMMTSATNLQNRSSLTRFCNCWRRSRASWRGPMETQLSTLQGM